VARSRVRAREQGRRAKPGDLSFEEAAREVRQRECRRRDAAAAGSTSVRASAFRVLQIAVLFGAEVHAVLHANAKMPTQSTGRSGADRVVSTFTP